MSGNMDVDGVVAHETDEIPEFDDGVTPEAENEETSEDEQEQPDDQDGAEVEEEAETDEAEEPGDQDDPEPEPEPKGHDRDKGLTRLQQRQAQFEREQAAFQNEVKNTLERLTKAMEARNDGKPTAEQQKDVEDAQDDLDELLNGDADDFVDVATVKKLVGKLKSQKPVDVQAEVQKALQAHEDQRRQQEAEQKQYVKQAEQRFYDEHPDLEGRFDELTQQAIKALEKEQGAADEMDATEFNTLFNRIYWPQAVKDAEAKLHEDPKPSKARPAGNKPPKPAKGTSTKPQGASANKDSGSGSEIVGFDPTIDEIPEFVTDD